MEDPWANAWGDSSKTNFSDNISSSSAWSAPSVSAIHGDHEDDLSLPSWSAQPEVQWTDPDNAGTSLWTSDPSTVWNPAPSTFDQISMTDDSNSVTEIEPRGLSPSPQDDPQSSPPTSPPLSIANQDDHSPISPIPKPTSYSPPVNPLVMEPSPPLDLDAAEDVDAFGTFETANDEADTEEFPSTTQSYSLPSTDDAVWGGAWGAHKSESPVAFDKTTSSELDNAWEVARQQKEKQDRHVPPEMLASIIEGFKNVSDELWPDSAPLSSDIRDSQRPMDMEEHLGLGQLVQRLIPDDLTLPPTVPFPTTFTSKQSSEALKMTRHAPLTRFSPMAFYMSSKGLTSWEASVKAKPNILSDDVVPVGWKILEGPKGEVTTIDDPKKKPSGGLLSFFGRRGTNAVDSAPAARSASPSISVTSSAKPGASPRPSIDSTRPASIRSMSIKGGSTAPSSPIVPSSSSTPPIIPKSEFNPIPDNTVISPAITSPAESTPDVETASQPSAVSRFFGRFSTRPKSLSRDSLSLSNDDLEFLADVPTIDTNTDSNTGLDALSMMIQSPPLTTALPPPLKPPPRAPPAQISKPPNRIENSTDDFMSFFDNPFSSPMGTVPTPPVGFTQHNSSSTEGFPSDTRPPTAQSSHLLLHNLETFTNQPASSLMSKTTQTKRPFVAIMSSSSSSRPSSTPPLLPKPTSGFVLPPPPSNRQPQLSSNTGSTSNIPPLLPPPSSRSHTPQPPLQLAKPPAPTLTAIDDDDDFTDFLSSPTQFTQTNTSHSFGSFTSATSGTAMQSFPNLGASPNNLLGDFDDFMSPTPPQPPAKSLKKSPPPLSSQVTNGTVRRTSRAADHARTQGLLESVAARGRWLGPPSPLPEALAPPESNGISSKGDLFSSGSSMQSQQAQATASLAGFPSSVHDFHPPLEKPPAWNFPPPTSNSPLPMIPSKQPVLQSTYPAKNVSASGDTKSGGLSAQDLSFFEGL